MRFSRDVFAPRKKVCILETVINRCSNEPRKNNKPSTWITIASVTARSFLRKSFVYTKYQYDAREDSENKLKRVQLEDIRSVYLLVTFVLKVAEGKRDKYISVDSLIQFPFAIERKNFNTNTMF